MIYRYSSDSIVSGCARQKTYVDYTICRILSCYITFICLTGYVYYLRICTSVFSNTPTNENVYSGTCLNRPAMGPATYGLFIQVVSLCKFEILESVFNRSIRLHVL